MIHRSAGEAARALFFLSADRDHCRALRSQPEYALTTEVRPRKDKRGVDLIFIIVDRALPSPGIE